MKMFAQSPTDVALFKELFKDSYTTTPLLTASFNGLDKAKELGFKKIEFIRPTEPSLNETTHYHFTESDRFAKTLDSEYGFLCSRALNLEFLASGFMHVFFAYVIYTGLRTRYLAKAINIHAQSDELLVLKPTNMPYLYFDSSFNKQIFLNALKENWAKVVDTQRPVINFNPHFNYNLNNLDFESIAHVPTIFYEKEHLLQKLSGHSNILQLKNQVWEVDINQPNITPSLNQQINLWPNELTNYFFKKIVGITQKLYNYFSIDLNPSELAHYFFKIFTSQINLFIELENAQRRSPIKNIFVSDQDTGITGVLMAFSQKYKIPVDVFAHSFTPIGRLYDTTLTKRHNLIRGTDSYNSLSGNLQKANRFNLALDKKAGGGKKILILLNEFDDIAFVPTDDYVVAIPALNNALSSFRANEFEIRIRPKPGNPYKSILNIPESMSAQGPISNWIKWPDHVVSMGTPTTALIHFAEQGAHTYHLQEEHPTEPDLAMLHPSTKVIIERNWNSCFAALGQEICGLTIIPKN